jgi:hypothetical protein
MGTYTKTKNGRRVGSPADATTLVTIEDVQRFGTFFKDLIESSHLRWWIILAGVGGLCELVRLVVDAVKFGLQVSGYHLAP